MQLKEIMETYLQGWMKGDHDMIIDTLAENFVLDDPQHGSISAENFPQYMEILKAHTPDKPDYKQYDVTTQDSFMLLTDILMEYKEEFCTTWYWWQVCNTNTRGSALVKASTQGIHSEIVTYYTKITD